METVSCASQWQKDLDVKSYFLPPALMDLGTLHVWEVMYLEASRLQFERKRHEQNFATKHDILLLRFLWNFHSDYTCPVILIQRKVPLLLI